MTNDGGTPYQVSDVFLGGDDADEFEIMSDSCSGTEVNDSQSCAVSLRYHPDRAGDHLAALVLDNPGGGDAFGVFVHGFAFERPAIAADHGVVSFPATRTDVTSAPAAIKFTNVGDGPASLGSALIDGPDSHAFAVASNTCEGTVLAPGGSCTVRVTFRPQEQHANAATLLLVGSGLDSPSNTPYAVVLSGRGIQPADIRIEPAPLDLGTLSAPWGFVSKQVLIENTAGRPVWILPSVPVVTPRGAVTLDPYDCLSGPLAVGGSCTVRLQLVPKRNGRVTGTFEVSETTSHVVLATAPVTARVTGVVTGPTLVRDLAKQLAVGARGWTRTRRRALRQQGFRIAFKALMKGKVRLTLTGRSESGAAARRIVVARGTQMCTDGARHTLRARVTRPGKRYLARPGLVRLSARLHFWPAYGVDWDASRAVRLR